LQQGSDDKDHKVYMAFKANAYHTYQVNSSRALRCWSITRLKTRWAFGLEGYMDASFSAPQMESLIVGCSFLWLEC
jgi:hypothetical protein